MRKVLIIALMLFTVGCQKQASVPQNAVESELHPESYTNWTTKTELFAEYIPLVVGKTSRFAVHITRLDTFKPVAQGKVEIQLLSSTGEVQSFGADAPSSPGIFGVDVNSASVGEYQLSVRINGPGLNDAHELGEIAVSETTGAAIHEHSEAGVEKIAFLKEQQWTLDFGTAVIEDRQLRSSIRVPAEVHARSGGQAEVTVPFDGRLVGSNLPVIGSRVAQGQVLASLIPPTSSPSDLSSLELARNEASLALALARKDRERAERLVNSGAAPSKRLDEALTVEATVEARLRAAEVRVAQYEASSSAEATLSGAKAFALRAPIAGIVIETTAAPNANVKLGEALFRIIDADSVYISATVPETELQQVRNLTGAELQVPGSPDPSPLSRLVSVGRVVDPQSRTLPVTYQMDNRDQRVAIGQAVHVRLLTRPTELSPAVPETALVDDGGRPVIFVQDSGETFIRRPVKIGVREGGFVQILEGALPGERVVVTGAHLIRLASMSSQVPAHGHVH